MVKMDKASISAKSYEEQQKHRGFLSAGFSWLKTQFSSGSHHNVEQAKSVEPIPEKPLEQSIDKSVDTKIEKKIDKKIEESLDKTVEQPQKHEHRHKHHKHKSLSKGSSRKALKSHDVQSEPKFNTVSERSHTRKKNRKSGSHVSFNLESTEAFSALSGSEDHDLMPPVKKNVFVDIKPMESLVEQGEQTARILESKIELPELQEQLEQIPVPVVFEAVSEIKEVKPEVQLQAMLEAAPQTAVVEALNQVEPTQSAESAESEEPREDFSSAIRHRAFEKHKRNSQRLSGQFPKYDEDGFIEGGRDVDFIRIQNGTGRYWNHPGRPGQVAGQIDHDVMDGITYQRLGYLASLGDAEAHEKIEAAKNRNSAFKK